MSGSACSRSGKAYEMQVAGVCARLRSPFMKTPLNTQSPKELGGCSAKQDIILNCKEMGDVNVEVKSKNVPDWIQCSIIPQQRLPTKVLRWTSKQKSYQPPKVVKMFERTINQNNIFGGNVPSFLVDDKPPTHAEWMRESCNFKDAYYPIPSTSIARAYKLRGVHYIQVKGHGLFHTGTDVCRFGVPLFSCSQRLRIRCKRHGKKCSITGKNVPSSVMASFRPILSTLGKSGTSLDNIELVPKTLTRLE
jgi:hypothetical protein